MSLKQPENLNYCATVVEIKNIIPLEKMRTIQHTSIFGNLVIISKDAKVGDIGLFFPPESQLSKEFLSSNNLYGHSELNLDKTKKGYFSDNGRVRTVKFQGHKSMGFFIPLDSLVFTNHTEKLKIGNSFDEINGIKICQKYFVFKQNAGQQTDESKVKQVYRIVDKQWRFHLNTEQLGKNIDKIKDTDLVSITVKLHGTSFISAKILCKRKLSLFERVLKFCGVKIIDKEYDNVWASRSVIKNPYFLGDKEEQNHFYGIDIWGLANIKIKEFLQAGMTVYGEIVGYTPNGNGIQKMNGKVFDYGCVPGEFEIYIYRITCTNTEGKVFEFSGKQVQNWCKENGLKAVPELYYGYARDLFVKLWDRHEDIEPLIYDPDIFLDLLKKEYLEQDSVLCKNTLPEEGIVLRIEKNNVESYKLKSWRFLEAETKSLDNGEIDMETSGEETSSTL